CLERAAEAAHLAGDADQAVALLDERLAAAEDHVALPGEPAVADPGPTGLQTALLHARMAEYLVAAGRGAEAARAFDRASALLPPEGADHEWAEVLGGRAAALWTAGDHAGARETAQRALGPARRCGAAAVQARALATLGFSLAYLEDPAAGEEALQESLAVAERAGDPAEIGRAYRGLAELLSGPLNEPERGVALARTGAARVRELGLARSAGAGLLAVAANGLFRLGRWDDAEAAVAEGWQLGPSGAEALELRLARARLTTLRGHFDAAEDDLEALLALSTGTLGGRYRIPALTLCAGVAMWRFRPDLALDHVAAGLDVVEQGSDDVYLVAPLVWHGARARAELTRLGVRRPDDGIAARLHRHAADLAARAATAVPAVREVLHAYLRMCAAEDGRAEDRSDPVAWQRCVADWTAVGQPHPTAYAHLRHGEALLARRANSAAAGEALREAARITSRLGVTPLLAEIRELAERARVRLDDVLPGSTGAAAEPSGAGPSPRPADGPDELDALTAREVEVLVELAGGLTNREIAGRLFISEKTVGVHVSRIYTKIGVHSRVQASAVLLRARPERRR
ncbi:MAG TPA: helix-turn-helix transcriptional regulator, partial [Pseudonocardia sp.]|nr:helix-turn-helix transcriptional regulator [Pseudonocardia sp.]